MPVTAENRRRKSMPAGGTIGPDPAAMPGKRQALRRAPAGIRSRCLASARRSGAPRPASARSASAVGFAHFDPPAVDNQAWLSYADLWVKNRAWRGHHIFIKGTEKAVSTHGTRLWAEGPRAKPGHGDYRRSNSASRREDRGFPRAAPRSGAVAQVPLLHAHADASAP
jgi:hypothetical protein